MYRWFQWRHFRLLFLHNSLRLSSLQLAVFLSQEKWVDLSVSVYEIKGFCCAHTGCTGSQNRASGCLFILIYSYQYVRKSMHTPAGAQVLKYVHPSLCKCAHRVQGAPLITNTGYFITYLQILFSNIVLFLVKSSFLQVSKTWVTRSLLTVLFASW